MEEALAKYGDLIDEGKASPEKLIEFAAAVGSYEILAMTGAYIGAASQGIPTVVDGYISISAALLAAEMAPRVKDYLFTSHNSQEAGYRAAADKLGIKPMFDLGMKLGEASGCPIAFKIIEAACAAMNGMKTLEEGQIDYAYLDELSAKGEFI